MCVCVCVHSCCNNSRYKCRAGYLPHDYLHWNLLPEKVDDDSTMHHFNVVVCTQTLSFNHTRALCLNG